jgi:hypothetical protein
MRDFTQDIQIKQFDLNIGAYTLVQLGNKIYSNSFYTTGFNHQSPENYDRLIIGLHLTPYSEATQGVKIQMYSFSIFNNQVQLSFNELVSIFEKSLFVLNETLVSRLGEAFIVIPHPQFKKKIMLIHELSDYHHAAYPNY